jgi:hypothetical protein
MKIYEIVTEDRSDEGIADIAKGAATGIAKGAKWAKDAITGTKAGAEVAKDAGKAKKGAEVVKNIDKVKPSAEAISKLNSFGSAYVGILSALGITYYFLGYWTEILKLEAEWTEYQNSLKSKSQVPSSNRFAGKDYDTALGEAEGIREELLGKAIAGCLMSAGIFGKVLQVFGTLFKVIPIFGPLIGSPLIGIGWLISKLESSGPISATVRAAFLTWLETTDTGKEFMKNIFTVLILGGVGKVASIAIDALTKLADLAVEFVNEKLGTNFSKPSDSAAATKIKPDAEVEKEIDSGVKIDGIPATTADGYLRADRPFWVHNKVKWEIEKQMNAGKPNPLTGIPKNPKLKYPTDLFTNLSYSG